MQKRMQDVFTKHLMDEITADPQATAMRSRPLTNAPGSVTNKFKWATKVVIHIVLSFICFELSMIPKV